MKRDYQKLLQSANTAMLEKLKKNDHKSGFDNIDFIYALDRTFKEWLELRDAMMKGLYKKEIISEVRAEAADVANFAAMIIYRCDNELNRKK